ncbi:MAG: cation:proton antiporter [Dehalococcoidales bacterium]|jgi:multicomponent Na+:H+ antiporter subunit D|nr:cation:proton antiporter [Dehalococcoidales bacterium]MDP6576817.1 monovalent cation/H+ antiporter subunit D family protein [Dehalococcoidales bacterium]
METYYSLKPLLAVLVSLLAVVLIVIPNQRPNVRESWTIMAAVAKFTIVLSMLPSVLQGQYPEITLFAISPGISLALKVDSLGIIFGLSASLLWVLASFFSIGYVRGVPEHKQTRYFASFAICLSATMGIAFAANLLTLVVFYEILTIATYPLVIHKETGAAIAAGRRYLVYLLTGGVALLLALALTYQISDSVDFRAGGILPAGIGKSSLILLFILFLTSFGVKSAIMPMHSWLPAAMAAPTPVSALLHAVAVVKAGVFGFARIIGFIIGPGLLQKSGMGDFLAALTAITIIVASLVALRQDNLKMRLAYSTVSHLSYIVLGLALFSPSAWIGGLLHIVNHAMTKITLFFCAGAIYVRTHCQNVSEMNGIGRQMPITMSAFTLASLGLAGIPPINGFISKWYLVQGTLDVGQTIYAATFLISGLLNAGYLMSIVCRAFFRGSDKFVKYGEVSPSMLIPLVLTAMFSLLLGLFPDQFPFLFQLAARVASNVLGGGGP